MADTEYTGFMYAAHRDVLIVENLAKEIDPYTEAIAFHSRQAAEKMVKNVFIQNGIVPSKTHSVDELLSKAIDSGWLSVEPQVIDAAINISMHAVAARYSQMPDIDRGEALQAIADRKTTRRKRIRFRRNQGRGALPARRETGSRFERVGLPSHGEDSPPPSALGRQPCGSARPASSMGASTS